MHIFSIVAHVDPAQAARVRAAIGRVAGLATHAASAEGKLVVTIEAATEAESIALMEQVRTLAGVMSVAMVFHQYEPDPDQEL